MSFEAIQALGFEIAGSGSALPVDLSESRRVVGEVDEEEVYRRLLGMSFAAELESRKWSRERAMSLGVERRQWCVEPGRSREPDSADAYDLGLAAGERAMKDSGVDPKALDGVIVTSSTAPRISASIAHRITRAWGIDSAAYDLKAGGAGAVHAWLSALGLMQIGARSVLVIAAETPSYYVHPQDLTSALLFGDGAGALVLQRTETGDGGLVAGLLGSAQLPGRPFTIPAELPPLLDDIGGSRFTFQREDAEYRGGLRGLSLQTSERLREAYADTTWFVPYAVTRDQVDSAAKALGTSPEKTRDGLRDHGCLGCAGPLVTIDALRKSGDLQDGDVITTTAVAGGNAWGGLHWRIGSES